MSRILSWASMFDARQVVMWRTSGGGARGLAAQRQT